VAVAVTEAPILSAEPLETGAAAALGRLETAEAAAYGRLEAALATHDAVEIRNARESWLKLCHSLRLYEAAVDDNKRERGLLVEKSEVLQGLHALAGVFHSASNEMINSLSPQIAEERDIIRCRQLIRRCTYGVAFLSYTYAQALGVPAWFAEPFRESYCGAFTASRAEWDAAAVAIKEHVRLCVENTVAAVPSCPAPKEEAPEPPPPTPPPTV
jgi:hypothetical protein